MLDHTKFDLKGDFPWFNEWDSPGAIDHGRKKLYTYGGVRASDDENTPTSDFHCLDLQTMEWINLTNSLRFRAHSDPFLKDPRSLATRPLPALLEPAIALISVAGGTFFILFGGCDDARNVKSAMIAVDLDILTWWVVNVQGDPIHPIRPRLSASMVAIDNRLFIFGGRDEFEDDNDPPRPPPPILTFSIARYTAQTGWEWQVLDRPAPLDLDLGYGIQATPVYNGQKILLMQGRVQNPKPITLSAQSTKFFHTQNLTFQDASTTVGVFPDKLAWYDLGSLVTGPPPPALPLAAGINDPDPVVPLPNFPPSAVIVGWINRRHNDLVPENEDLVPEDNDLVLEAWQYLLPPVEKIRCLHLVDDLFNLERDFGYDADFDFHSLVPVGNRLLLLGSKEARNSPTARLDIAVEISSKYLTE